MTIVRVDEETKIAGNNRRYSKIVITLMCDHCNVEFICPENSKNRALKQELHFCSKKCSSADMSNGGKLKSKQVQKIIETYGTTNFFDTDVFKAEQQKLCLKKYGVKSRLEATEILNKIKETNIIRYGKETYTGSEDYFSKVDHKEIARKAWLTKIKNGTCSRSGAEEALNTILVQNFGLENIQRQVPMIRQWIDFYIKKLDIYIQVDGVYWHGLDRDIKIIKQQATSQDKKIYKQIFRDQKLNEHMKLTGMKLLRISDEQIKKMSSNDILELILNLGDK
jgi:very-short-patch-repair endonuclease